MKTPRAKMRRAATSENTTPGLSSTAGAFNVCSSCAPRTRFASALFACQLPRATAPAHAQPARSHCQARGRKEYPESMRYVVIAVLLAIVASLASALIFMYRDRGNSRRMVKALALRVGLSVGL